MERNRTTRSSLRNSIHSPEASIDRHLSDTEEMDDDDEEEEDDDDSEYIPSGMHSSESMNPPTTQSENIVDPAASDVSENYIDGIFLHYPRRVPRFRRIYFQGRNEVLSDDENNEDEHDSDDEEDDTSSSSSNESSEPVMNSASEDESETEEGRASPNNNVSMRAEDSDSDLTNVTIVSNGEGVSFYPQQRANLGHSSVAPDVEPSASSSNSCQSGPPTSDSVRPAETSTSSTSKAHYNDASASSSSSTVAIQEEDESQTCPICFEIWSSAGEHRIVSLKCGHLFGKKCIERWLKGQGGKCPQCNAKATKKDIRVIYARCLKAEDTTEKVRLNQQIEKLRKEKAHYEKEKAQLKLKNTLHSQLIKNLQEQLRMIKESYGSVQIEDRDGACMSKMYKLAMFRSFELAKSGSCRVMAFNEWMNMLVVSIQSQVELFPGFGVKKINTLDLKVENYMPLHCKQIRDLQFNPVKRDLLLSVGTDKVAKITNVSSNSTVVSYTTKYPLWCCCWNSSKSYEFFAGTNAGSVYHFDTVQNTNEPITTYQISGSGPVVSISYVPLDHSKDFHLAGLIVTRLTSISFLELLETGIKEHNLPIEGSFSHTAFDPVSRHLLATCRPTDRNPHARHILCELKVINVSDDPATISNVVSVHQVYCFQGSTTMKVLSRACLTTPSPNMNNRQVVIFSEESTSSFKLYDASTSGQIQSIKTNSHVIDILPIQSPDGRYVAMLSEKSLLLYKWVEHLAKRQ